MKEIRQKCSGCKKKLNQIDNFTIMIPKSSDLVTILTLCESCFIKYCKYVTDNVRDKEGGKA